MKALFERDGELAVLEGPATAVLAELEELASDESFVGSRLFFTSNEAGAIAELDQRSDLLDEFVLGLTENIQPTANAKAGCLTTTRYEPVGKEAEMTHEEQIRLDIVNALWDESGTGMTYSGAVGDHFDPLDLMPYDEEEDDDDPQVFTGAGGTHPNAQFNQTRGMSRSSDEPEGEPLDLPVMNWDEPKKTTKNKRGASDDVEPLDLPEALF